LVEKKAELMDQYVAFLEPIDRQLNQRLEFWIRGWQGGSLDSLGICHRLPKEDW